MNFVIDVGNTLTKTSLFKNKKLIKKTVCKSDNLDEVTALLSLYSGLKAGIFSSVSNRYKKINKKLISEIPFFIDFSSETPVPLKNAYQTPKTLGKDRLAAVCGAKYLFPENDVLVIDAGTAITIDFIDKKGVYQGGIISPGLNMRFKALHSFTKRLPLISPSDESVLTGNTTESSIRAGVQNSCVFEMNEYVARFKRKHNCLITIITGGDAVFFEKKLKNPIFADSDLVLKGLNFILDYNLKLKN
ncbi:MAG: hypothetical protein A2275_03020 [Bacteroidetes bacterium RIFOXYA12_FULL_35_11]|nr:MAG: hypothetical protein A2X01_15560 [Bacteroidetes bacterium GWF2_35_48]OFY77759.1 MAG: hypothetical protein A2275_03020 [Bacteroidetes bacterium RIFOXYA12_FULL_35_11]OFY94356.1 MAG: hypothetical protein A2491_00580 [Bacteroidetes bacterium RIFOXYC12_FULL_35_7]OFY97028.1 MAG: hypothetical protein A2309_07920 [Bacteroidetes bacterium RIFOXYB2_FULL_35_7]HBX49865.1 pantothenate kinase [Bacteroidales bacterium]